MIENMRINRELTTKTFFIEGIEANSAFTTSLIPSFLEITLSGLNALSALRAFRAYNY